MIRKREDNQMCFSEIKKLITEKKIKYSHQLE